MANPSASLLVVLDGEYNPDSAQAIAGAIKMIKGVLSVDAVPTNMTHYVAKQMAKSEIRQQMQELLNTNK